MPHPATTPPRRGRQTHAVGFTDGGASPPPWSPAPSQQHQQPTSSSLAVAGGGVVDVVQVAMTLLAVIGESTLADIQVAVTAAGSSGMRRQDFTELLCREVAIATASDAPFSSPGGASLRDSQKQFKELLRRRSMLAPEAIDLLVRSVDRFDRGRVTFSAFIDFLLLAGRKAPHVTHVGGGDDHDAETTAGSIAPSSRHDDSRSLAAAAAATDAPVTAKNGLAQFRVPDVAPASPNYVTRCLLMGTSGNVALVSQRSITFWDPTSQVLDTPLARVDSPMGATHVITAAAVIVTASTGARPGASRAPSSGAADTTMASEAGGNGGRTLHEVACAFSGGRIMVFDAFSGRCVRESKAMSEVSSMVWAPRCARWGRVVASANASATPSQGMLLLGQTEGNITGMALSGDGLLRVVWSYRLSEGPVEQMTLNSPLGQCMCAVGGVVFAFCTLRGVVTTKPYHLQRSVPKSKRPLLGGMAAHGQHGVVALTIRQLPNTLLVFSRHALTAESAEVDCAPVPITRTGPDASDAALIHVSNDPWSAGFVLTLDALGYVSQWDITTMSAVPTWVTRGDSRRPPRIPGDVRSIVTVKRTALAVAGKTGIFAVVANGDARFEEALRAYNHQLTGGAGGGGDDDADDRSDLSSVDDGDPSWDAEAVALATSGGDFAGSPSASWVLSKQQQHSPSAKRLLARGGARRTVGAGPHAGVVAALYLPDASAFTVGREAAVSIATLVTADDIRVADAATGTILESWPLPLSTLQDTIWRARQQHKAKHAAAAAVAASATTSTAAAAPTATAGVTSGAGTALTAPTLVSCAVRGPGGLCVLFGTTDSHLAMVSLEPTTIGEVSLIEVTRSPALLEQAERSLGAKATKGNDGSEWIIDPVDPTVIAPAEITHVVYDDATGIVVWRSFEGCLRCGALSLALDDAASAPRLELHHASVSTVQGAVVMCSSTMLIGVESATVIAVVDSGDQRLKIFTVASSGEGVNLRCATPLPAEAVANASCVTFGPATVDPTELSGALTPERVPTLTVAVVCNSSDACTAHVFALDRRNPRFTPSTSDAATSEEAIQMRLAAAAEPPFRIVPVAVRESAEAPATEPTLTAITLRSRAAPDFSRALCADGGFDRPIVVGMLDGSWVTVTVVPQHTQRHHRPKLLAQRSATFATETPDLDRERDSAVFGFALATAHESNSPAVAAASLSAIGQRLLVNSKALTMADLSTGRRNDSISRSRSVSPPTTAGGDNFGHGEDDGRAPSRSNGRGDPRASARALSPTQLALAASPTSAASPSRRSDSMSPSSSPLWGARNRREGSHDEGGRSKLSDVIGGSEHSTRPRIPSAGAHRLSGGSGRPVPPQDNPAIAKEARKRPADVSSLFLTESLGVVDDSPHGNRQHAAAARAGDMAPPRRDLAAARSAGRHALAQTRQGSAHAQMRTLSSPATALGDVPPHRAGAARNVEHTGEAAPSTMLPSLNDSGSSDVLSKPRRGDGPLRVTARRAAATLTTGSGDRGATPGGSEVSGKPGTGSSAYAGEPLLYGGGSPSPNYERVKPAGGAARGSALLLTSSPSSAMADAHAAGRAGAEASTSKRNFSTSTHVRVMDPRPAAAAQSRIATSSHTRGRSSDRKTALGGTGSVRQLGTATGLSISAGIGGGGGAGTAQRSFSAGPKRTSDATSHPVRRPPASAGYSRSQPQPQPIGYAEAHAKRQDSGASSSLLPAIGNPGSGSRRPVGSATGGGRPPRSSSLGAFAVRRL